MHGALFTILHCSCARLPVHGVWAARSSIPGYRPFPVTTTKQTGGQHYDGAPGVLNRRTLRKILFSRKYNTVQQVGAPFLI